MSIVTLTTDLGYRDPYLALVKAKLISQTQNVNIVDLSCEIKGNNISHAAYILKNSLPHFPDNSIHLVAVKFLLDRSNQTKNLGIDNTRFLLTKYKNQFIVCPDNGLFTLIDKDFSEQVFEIYYADEKQKHFFLKDVFADVAAHLLKNNKIEDIAKPTADYYKAVAPESYVNGNVLRGKGIYVDDFGNIVCNISKEKFNEVIGKRKFSVHLPGKLLSEIHSTYDEVNFNQPVVIFNSFGYLEVAINGKSAAQMLVKRDIGNNFDFDIIIEIHD
ncbi:MAG: SAM-dependent chlorinase/fluorinase [Bacteroidetes bacterium]|nr:SAM-dependent chlorinase/fluorinase [Bacteroidota bacterium]